MIETKTYKIIIVIKGFLFQNLQNYYLLKVFFFLFFFIKD